MIKFDWDVMIFKGDTEGQAILRDRMIKKGKKVRRSRYISKILSVLKPEMSLLDIGCGTAHIISKLASCCKTAFFVGLDISPAMLKIANVNTSRNVMLVEGDGLKLPFPDCTFDIVITKLAVHSPQEACRVLRKRGYFFEYGLGPEADKEILEFFPERIEKENFFFPKDLRKWKQEVCEEYKDTSFVINSIEDYKEEEYYKNEGELMDLIEMVPLVKDFDREKDRRRVSQLAEKYRGKKGIKITWHYCIIQARRL